MPVKNLKKGAKVAAILSDDQAWSADTHSLQIGTSQVAYPILAMVKSSDGFHSLFPGILKVKTDIKAGETLRSDGYEIQAKREIKACPWPHFMTIKMWLNISNSRVRKVDSLSEGALLVGRA